MLPNTKIGLFILSGLIFAACNNVENRSTKTVLKYQKKTTLKYARRFVITHHENFTMVYLFGNSENRDTTASYVLYSDSLNPKNLPTATYTLKLPCKKIAALSSIYATMYTELGKIKNLVAIDNIDYVNNPEIITKYNKGDLKELARMPQVDVEQTVVLKPDIIFTFGMGNGEKDIDKKLQQTKIPLAISVDHLEESPLARAEWIKFFAVFVNEQEKADSIFELVEKNYFKLKEIAKTAKTKPSVFNELKYSDAWYVPGGKSFMAQLLNDAGANYLWKDDQKTGSLPLSFEQVYVKAKNADFWINLSSVKTKKELLSFESRYAAFAAFKNGNLYNNTKVINKLGYSIYWETGMIYPDRILSDLILIFHPELKPELKQDFYYYERIQ